MPDAGGGVVRCTRCEEPVLEDERVTWIPELRGLDVPIVSKPWHVECLMRTIIGGLNHQMGNCTCCGGTAPPDPPEMTKREAAKAAVAYWDAHNKPED